MAINFAAIKATYKASIEQASIQARTANSINNALEIQAEGYANALKVALEAYTSQATVSGIAVVAGGSTTPNGPVVGANLTGATIS